MGDLIQNVEAIYVHYIGFADKYNEWIFIANNDIFCDCEHRCDRSIKQKDHRIAAVNTQSKWKVKVQRKEKEIKFYVKTLTGRTFTLDYLPNDTIQTVKAKISQAAGISPCNMQLIYVGRRLRDGQTLNDYNIQKQSTLHLIQTMVGS